MLGLALAYMYERSLGPDSLWYEFIQTIDHDSLISENPRFWPPEDEELLVGTELYYHTLKVEDDDIAEVFKFDVLPFLERNHLFEGQPQYRTLEYYRDCLVAVASRAFDVDVYHGLALVPGACLFNHSIDESVHFEVVSQVCPLCGSPDFCDHLANRLGNHSESDEEEEEEEEVDELNEDGFSSGFDYSDSESDSDGFEDIEEEEDGIIGSEETTIPISEDSDKKTSNEQKSEEQEAEKYQYEEDDEDEVDYDEPQDTCDIVTIKSVHKGNEVFNTYGELSNHHLASRYGFAIWDNKYETVGLSPEIREYISENNLMERQEWWSIYFYEALFGIRKDEWAEIEESEDEDDEGSEDSEEENSIPPSPESISWEDEAYLTNSGAPSEGLSKLIRILSMSDSDFEALKSQFERDVFTSKLLPSSTLVFNEKSLILLKALVNLRLQRYKDGMLTSPQIKDLITKLSDNQKKNSRQILALTIKGTEKIVLEKSMQWIAQLEKKKKRKPSNSNHKKPNSRKLK